MSHENNCRSPALKNCITGVLILKITIAGVLKTIAGVLYNSIFIAGVLILKVTIAGDLNFENSFGCDGYP